MPTFTIGPFQMRFYSNDHAPPHIHCLNGDGTVVVNLATGAVVRVKGPVKARDRARAIKLVEEHRNMLLVEWNLFDMRRKDVR